MKQGGAEGELHMAISTQGAETEEKWRQVKSLRTLWIVYVVDDR